MAHIQSTLGEGSSKPLKNNYRSNVPIHWPTGVLYGFPSKNSILTTNDPPGNDRLRPRGSTIKSRLPRNSIGSKSWTRTEVFGHVWLQSMSVTVSNWSYVQQTFSTCMHLIITEGNNNSKQLIKTMQTRIKSLKYKKWTFIVVDYK